MDCETMRRSEYPGARRSSFFGVVIFLFSLVAPGGAHALEARGLSETETTTLNFGLAHFDRVRDSEPVGKRIGSILIYASEVFGEESLFFLRAANHLRIKTRDSVIREELLLKEGDFFDWGLVEENELHLIGSGFSSVVVIVPVEPLEKDRSDEVDLLVVTRDIWSLRLSSDFETAGSVLNYAFLSLTDTNLFGYNKRAQFSFLLRQRDYDVGARYTDPNLVGERYLLDLNQGFVMNRESGDLEGHYAGIFFGLPLYSRRSTFGYDLSLSYRSDVYRNLIGEDIAPFEIDGVEEEGVIPWEYPRLSVSGSAIFKRAYGYKYRNIFRFGYGARSFKPSVPDDLPEGSLTAEIFRLSLESWDQFSSYFITGYRFFEWRYLRLYNYNTYALAEYISLGPGADFETNWASSALLGSDRDYLYFTSTLWWTWGLYRDSTARVSLKGSTRLEGTFQSKYVGTSADIIFPSLGPVGRFVFSGGVDVVLDPISNGNPIFARGGEMGLRGLMYRSLQGDNFLQTNLEFRSGSLKMGPIRVGMVAFHDMGGVFQVGEGSAPIHSFGSGLRILILSTNRDVLRIDYGVPVNGPVVGFEHGLLTAGFGQAF